MSDNFVGSVKAEDYEARQKQVMIDDLSSCGDEEFARRCKRIACRALRSQMPYGLESHVAVELVHGIAAMRGVTLR